MVLFKFLKAILNKINWKSKMKLHKILKMNQKKSSKNRINNKKNSFSQQNKKSMKKELFQSLKDYLKENNNQKKKKTIHQFTQEIN